MVRKHLPAYEKVTGSLRMIGAMGRDGRMVLERRVKLYSSGCRTVNHIVPQPSNREFKNQALPGVVERLSGMCILRFHDGRQAALFLVNIVVLFL